MLLSRSRLRRVTQHNLHTLRTQPLSELSGSLGDLGTLLPLLIALTRTSSIHLPSTLIFTGLANIATGALFGLPLPVQPMKAIAATAIARAYSLEQTMAAGLGVAAVIGLMSATGALRWAARVVPVPVVKGIQVGAGLSLVLSAGEKLLRPVDWAWARRSNLDSTPLALLAFLALLACTRAPRAPYALLMLALGLLLSALASPTSRLPPMSHAIPLVIPTWPVFARTFLDAALAQLPLTTLNSVLAVAHLAADLLPGVPAPGVGEIGASVALMNLAGCWFGAMPACHGSGGLAAQHRFGARSGASVIILGFAKLLLGLVGGDAFLALLAEFPRSLLGVMVVAAGVELAKVGESLNSDARDLWEEAEADAGADGQSAVRKIRRPGEQECKDRWMVMLVTVAGILAFKNDGVGFVVGMLWHWGLKKAPREESRGAPGADPEEGEVEEPYRD